MSWAWGCICIEACDITWVCTIFHDHHRDFVRRTTGQDFHTQFAGVSICIALCNNIVDQEKIRRRRAESRCVVFIKVHSQKHRLVDLRLPHAPFELLDLTYICVVQSSLNRYIRSQFAPLFIARTRSHLLPLEACLFSLIISIPDLVRRKRPCALHDLMFHVTETPNQSATA